MLPHIEIVLCELREAVRPAEALPNPLTDASQQVGCSSKQDVLPWSPDIRSQDLLANVLNKSDTTVRNWVKSKQLQKDGHRYKFHNDVRQANLLTCCQKRFEDILPAR